LVSPDSTRVIYRADQDTNNVRELYTVPIGGGTPIKLNGTLTPDGEVRSDFVVSPDSTRVIYRADQDTDNVTELYSVPIGGGTPTKLNAPLTPDGNVGSFVVSPGSDVVAFTAFDGSATNLFVVDIGIRCGGLSRRSWAPTAPTSSPGPTAPT